MIKLHQHELVVAGKIDYENAEQYYQTNLQLIQQQSNFPLVVNLAELEQGSTLALAVLVRWLRQTPNTQGLQFKAVPEKMFLIFNACNFLY